MKIREDIEQLEKESLSTFAKLASESEGREIFEIEDPTRTCFMRDRDRIIHSKAFRRLKHKTQVYISPNNDHFRTRLTHTLEVNQIARTIGKALRLNEDLIEAIALGHDVGHTPFAHSGEEVLDDLMTDGFRHNENSVRVLTKIEQRHGGRGLNISKEVLDGVLNHRGFDKDITRAKTLEGQVVRLSDKVAYVQHDIDDSIRGGILTKEDLPKEPLEILGQSHSERITTLVTDAIKHSRYELENNPNPKIALSPEVKKALIDLRSFMFENIYKGEVCSKERESAMYVVEYLYKHYKNDPQKLPSFYQAIVKKEGIERGVADYISGMSDNYCVSTFKELVIPRSFL